MRALVAFFKALQRIMSPQSTKPIRTDGPGFSREFKVLVKLPDGTCDGHRAYPIAFNKVAHQAIMVAATQGEGFVWGRLYLVAELVKGHHDYVVREIDRVPHEGGWELFESGVNDKAGRIPA